MPRVDFSQSRKPSPEDRIPAGKYFCRVHWVQEKDFSGDLLNPDDAPIWTVGFRMETAPYVGRILTDVISFEPEGLSHFLHFILSAGLHPKCGQSYRPDMLVGRAVVVSLVEWFRSNEEGETETRVQVADYEPVESLLPGESRE